jgi:hypothetical protein
MSLGAWNRQVLKKELKLSYKSFKSFFSIFVGKSAQKIEFQKKKFETLIKYFLIFLFLFCREKNFKNQNQILIFFLFYRESAPDL